MESIERRIAYVISAHGLGHAARASAVMEAACRMDQRLRFEIFTEVPQWFFRQSLTGSFGYHRYETDLGLVQKDPFTVDLAETVRRLDRMLPFDEAVVKELARRILDAACDRVICDIAPLGILAARAAGLPSALVENFTWDWIYEGYIEKESRLEFHADYLREIFDAAQFHIQTEPVCAPSGRAALRTLPVSREQRTLAHVTRERLGIPQKAKAVLISMGGFQMEYPFINLLERESEIFFIIPGASTIQEIRGNLVLLPYASDFYHPDLVGASDAVVGKLGYSTLAETYHCGVPFCYVMREGFRESIVLAKFAGEEMKGRACSEEELANGLWLSRLKEMLLNAPARLERPNGAQEVAAFILKELKP